MSCVGIIFLYHNEKIFPKHSRIKMVFFESAKIKRLPNYLLILCLVATLATSCTNGEEELIKLKADAEKGRTTAQYSLARMYHKGNKIPRNYEKAMKWYQIVANKGNYRAQYFVGNMYFRGHGVEQDYKEAKKWFLLSAKQGSKGSQHFLGFIYSDGLGVNKDLNKALKWYKLAAEQNDKKAQFFIGNIYYEGLGVSKDLVQAHLWFHLAGVNGNRKGVKLRGKVEQKLTPAQYDEAIKLYREWKPKMNKG